MKTDYNFTEKQKDYREPLWSAVDKHLDYKNRKNRTILYLDSAMALDTLHLLKLGYLPQNLHACNYEKANLAHVTMKVRANGYEDINIHTGEFYDSAFNIAQLQQSIDVVSFDGTSNCDIANASLILQSAVALRAKVLTFTMLMGRETGYNLRLIKIAQEVLEKAQIIHHDSRNDDISAKAYSRIIAVLMMMGTTIDNSRINAGEERLKCICHFSKPTWSFYNSGNQIMIWFVVNLYPHSTKPRKSYEPLPFCQTHLAEKWYPIRH